MGIELPPSKTSTRELGVQQKHSRRVAELVSRLLSHYWTATDPPAARQAQIEDWLEDLIELPIDCVEEACREWRRSQPDKRPTPGHIRILAIAEQRRRNPPPEPVYLPLPEPRMADPVERAEMARRMGELSRIVTAGRVMPASDGTTPRPTYEDPEALRRARIELGLEPMVEEVGSEI